MEDLLSQAKGNACLSNTTYACYRRTIAPGRINTSQKGERVQISNKFPVYICPIFKTNGLIVYADYLCFKYNAKLILNNEGLEKGLCDSTILRRR